MQASTLLLRALYVYMRDENLDTKEFLRRTGLTPHEPEQARLLDPELASTAIEAAFRAGAAPALALRLGASSPLQALGAWGQLIEQCRDLRSAVAAARRFMPLFRAGGLLTLTETGQFATLHYDPANREGPVRRFEIELALSLMITVMRRFVGKAADPRRVLVPYDAPPYRGEYDELFRCPVAFQAESAALLFDRALLDLAQPFSDDQLRELLETRLEHLQRAADRSTPLHVRVRALLEHEDRILAERKFRDLARKLGLSRRTLRRKLSAEGQTMSGLLEECRKKQAIYLLVERNILVKDVADRLGFSEPSAFTRAFKRWTGTSPLRFRRAQQRLARADAA